MHPVCVCLQRVIIYPLGFILDAAQSKHAATLQPTPLGLASRETYPGGRDAGGLDPQRQCLKPSSISRYHGNKPEGQSKASTRFP